MDHLLRSLSDAPCKSEEQLLRQRWRSAFVSRRLRLASVRLSEHAAVTEV